MTYSMDVIRHAVSLQDCIEQAESELQYRAANKPTDPQDDLAKQNLEDNLSLFVKSVSDLMRQATGLKQSL